MAAWKTSQIKEGIMSAYNDGKAAFAAGKDFTDNPHKKTWANHERWAMGWKDAAKEARK